MKYSRRWYNTEFILEFWSSVAVSKMNGRNYLGFEIVKEYFEFAKERLEKNVYRIKSAEQANAAFAL